MPEPIAVIGLGCRLAGDVTTAQAFWDFLLAGGSAVREVPAERWEPYLWRDPRNAAVLKETTPWGTFIDNLAGFDAEFFGVSPREAELMDPQQRLALEVSWEALEHAGVPPRSLAGSDTAVLMGVNSDDYGKLLMEDLPGIEAWTGIGTSLCGIANRVSHLLDLRGPSVALDAACAASLVAVHQACQLLRSGETALALAGGVSALIGPGLTRVLDQAGATAPDGRCKTFDASADGYGRGEGAAVVVLKRLADAVRDGDRVLAVVRGGAVAQDGRTVGIMSPNGAAQADLFRLACRSCDIDPATVDFIEAHGTGTPTGDPVEVAALAEVYGAARPDDDPALVGSVKPNTGHLEGGAGAVGLIKAVLALHHQRIPPTAGVRNLTPAVDWDTSGLRVPTESQAWSRRPGHPRRAAVCSYGYGGTLAHVLLEEAPPASRVAPQPAEPVVPVVIPLSGRSESRLAAHATALAEHLGDRAISLPEIAATQWARRSHEAVRAAVVAESTGELLDALSTLAAGGRDAALVRGSVLPAASEGAVWVFSGHGSHWPQMGQELLAGEPAFAAVIDAIDPIFGAELGFSAREALTSGELGGTDQVQALTFAMQVGLAAVLRERGVRPAAVIGHSVGEVAACVTAGVFSLAQGAAVACYRARGFRKVIGEGAMALVPLSFADAQQRLGARTDVVAAISASLTSTVVSGTAAAVDEVAARWGDEGLVVRRVKTDVAFHSPAMDALTADLARLTAALPAPSPAGIPLYSTALADPRSPAPRGPDYWVANLRDRVRFAEAVSAAAEDGHRLFLEVSAHPVVSHSIAETLLHLDIDEHAAVGVLRRDQPARRSVAAAVAALHCYGAPAGDGVASATPWAADLPGTQWQHRDFWRIPSAPPAGRGVHDTDSHTLLGGRLEVTGTVPARVWETRLDMTTRPYPGNHPVQGTEIVPAAVLLNTFLTAAGTDVTDVHLRTPVAPGRTRDVQVVLQDRALAIATRLVDDEGPEVGGWLTHCTAIASVTDDREVPRLDETAVRVRCAEQLPPNSVVDKLAKLGVAEMGFGWEVVDLWAGAGEFLAQVRAEPDGSHPSTWAGLIDAATSVASTVFDGAPRLRMPARIERMRVLGAPSDSILLHVRRRDQGTSTDVTIASLTGRPLVEITGMAFEELENTGGDVSRVIHRIGWQPTPFDVDATPAEVVLLGGDAAVQTWCERDLLAAGVAHRVCATPADLPAELGSDAVVLVLPRAGDSPVDAVDTVLKTLKALLHKGISARLWTLTQGVHEGTDVSRSPLWGLSRVAAAEHPTLWGGVLDLAEDRLPLGALATLSGHAVVVVRDGVAHTARLANIVGATGPAMECTPAGTYLITGGTGVLGLRIAERLADLGARRVVLLSRSGLPERSAWAAAENQSQIRAVSALEERGVWVHSVALDIAAPGAAGELRSVLADLPPVRGVVHAAGVEAGVFLANTTIDEIATTMHPKVDGALALHEMFAPGELDWMVLYSSCGYLAGFPGQGAYACGNAFLDALARHRRGLGDATTSVAWTAWRGLGMGSDSAYIAAQLDALGMDTIGADDALRALDVAMRSQEANPVVLPVLPNATSVPILADIAAAVAADSVQQNGFEQVGPGDMDTEEWVTQQVLTAVAAELGLSADSVDARMPLVEIGVDSIMTVALRRQLEKQTGLALPPTLLWEHPTAAAVTARIVELLDSEIASAATEDGAPVV
ncbi:polyketide synthase [Mycobacterium florentinum]|uniref:Polyketide synthase n=1 Tax=Mycobacterium florentinum TaxID=292462 RepID=A0A1X1ULA8_MYCFL|nr:type I polyketide synthase [Mycobacterium florentinum]ORV57571.1 polyketide synthase [Mycobacterium florentinum]BBX78557.1 phthiocerol synthesis polyketide synthase type I PpsA [Mycobacterium florentinum]